MHTGWMSIILNHSITLPAVIGLWRLRFTIAKEFYPFIFLMWMGFINESVSLLLITAGKSNTVNGNIYVLLEFIVILYQFYRWRPYDRRLYFGIAIGGILIWFADNFILSSITQNNSLFRASYSFAIVCLALTRLGEIAISERNNVLRNAIFIICVTFLFYYGCRSFVETFNAFHLGLGRSILRSLWTIMYFVNAISNILYAIAILCIPKQLEFSLPY